MKILRTSSLAVVFAFCAVAAALAQEGSMRLKPLLAQYAADDQRLMGARHYVKTTDGGKDGAVREEAWQLETGDVIKVARDRKQGALRTLEEFSFRLVPSEESRVYFAFRREEEKQADGGTRVTEFRSYFDSKGLAAKRRRIVNVPAGATTEISAELKSEELSLQGLPENEADGSAAAQAAAEIEKSAVEAKWLVAEPSRQTAEWLRVKVVNDTLSPDGHYALAISPREKKVDWEQYRDAKAEEKESYSLEEDSADNFIVDLRTHRVLAKTLCEHYGTRANYNHNGCTVAWSPDSRIFVQLTEAKWYFKRCCIGRLENGKSAGVLNLGDPVVKYAADFLKKTKDPIYRAHVKEMEHALAEPILKNDGTGSIRAYFQVRKAVDVEVEVRFRVAQAKSGLHLDMLSAKPASDQ